MAVLWPAFGRLRGGRTQFSDAYKNFRKKYSLKEVGLEVGFAASLRVPGAGREVCSGRPAPSWAWAESPCSTFMPGVRQPKRSRVTALVSGHRDKAEKMAAEYNVPATSIYSYENYDAIAGNKEIDAVYIALPNSMHAEYTIRAAKAGKHVLCEKPMATSVSDSMAMIDVCRKAGKRLMIAYRCQLEPTNLRAIRLIRHGKLGTIQAIESANGFNIRAGEWRSARSWAAAVR